jgi:hypothetical protein
MAEIKPTESHPAWEDMLGFGLGVLIVLTPMLVTEKVNESVQLATTAIGLLILIAAFIERMQIFEGAEERAREWEGILEAVLGAALIGMPFLFGYSTEGTLRYWHYALGGMVFLLAIVELRRDYVSDAARHGEQNIDASAWGNIGAVVASMILPLAVVLAAAYLW